MTVESSEARVTMKILTEEAIAQLYALATAAESADDQFASLKEMIQSIADESVAPIEVAAKALREFAREFGIFAGTTELPITKALQSLQKEALAADKLKFTNSIVETRKIDSAILKLKEDIKITALTAGTSFKSAAAGIRAARIDVSAKNMSTAL